jgi:hypothetical protein
MNIKLLFFPDKVIISQIYAFIPEEIGGSDLRLVEPFVVEKKTTMNVITEDYDAQFSTNFNLVPWLVEYTIQNTFEIHSDKLVTMAEPSNQLIALYKNAIQ